MTVDKDSHYSRVLLVAFLRYIVHTIQYFQFLFTIERLHKFSLYLFHQMHSIVTAHM